MKKPTIYEIKRGVLKQNPRAFDRKQMKLMGQTLKMFSVHKNLRNQIFVSCPGFNEKGKLMGYMVAEYIPKTRKLKPV